MTLDSIYKFDNICAFPKWNEVASGFRKGAGFQRAVTVPEKCRESPEASNEKARLMAGSSHTFLLFSG
jgi:hypothetical protein